MAQKRQSLKHLKSFEEIECKLKCGTCQRRYNSNFELMRHIRVHHDQSVGFACSGCTKRFQSALGLVVHFTIQHSDKLSYQCDKCHSTFAHPYSLKDHQKRAACSGTCPGCPKIYKKGFHTCAITFQFR